MLSAPTRTAPARSKRSIRVASAGAGGRSRLILEPASVASPTTSNRFLTAKGTPANGPSGLPAARAASIDRALARARSSVTAVKELRVLSRSLTRSIADSTTDTAVVLPAATAAAISAADAHGCIGSGLEHGRQLGFIGKLE